MQGLSTCQSIQFLDQRRCHVATSSDACGSSDTGKWDHVLSEEETKLNRSLTMFCCPLLQRVGASSVKGGLQQHGECRDGRLALPLTCPNVKIFFKKKTKFEKIKKSTNLHCFFRFFHFSFFHSFFVFFRYFCFFFSVFFHFSFFLHFFHFFHFSSFFHFSFFPFFHLLHFCSFFPFLFILSVCHFFFSFFHFFHFCFSPFFHFFFPSIFFRFFHFFIFPIFFFSFFHFLLIVCVEIPHSDHE